MKTYSKLCHLVILLFTVVVAGNTNVYALQTQQSVTAAVENEDAESVVSPVIARTKAWDAIEYTLGGIPESVRKIEFAGSVFYLGTDVSDADFLEVLAAGPEAVRMKPQQENGKLYNYPAYILWNADKTVLLVHPIDNIMDEVLEPVAIPADLPASLSGGSGSEQTTIQESDIKITAIHGMTKVQTVEYMLSAEYTEAVRKEFYRLLNEHRAANGLRELEIDLELQGYADIRADEQRILFGHTRPDGTPAGSGWHNSWNVINSRYAENCLTAGAIGHKPEGAARGMFAIWKESPGHNRHMLYDFEPHIKMGVGFAPKFENGFVISGGIFASGY